MKFQLGKHYKLLILDHSHRMSEPVKAKVSGWLVKEEKDYVVLTSWEPLNMDDGTTEDNREQTTILKKLIIGPAR